MDISPEFSQVSIAFLCYHCEEETERFFQHQEHDPRYCYEIFRRAIVGRDEVAWNCLYHRYQKLVSGWAEHHSLLPVTDEDVDMLVNRAFEKMWRGLTPEKFGRFSDLRAILRYLQLCLHSVIIDLARSAERQRWVETMDGDNPGDEDAETQLEEKADDTRLEDVVFYQREAEELWRLLEPRLKNEKERLVLYGVYGLALKPADLPDHFPGKFKNVREVYMVKDNLVERLRRDEKLKALYESQ